MSERMDAIRSGRARAEILNLIRTRHRGQQSRMDHVELWHMLRGVGLDIGENDVITYLQDLAMMDYVEFTQENDRRTNRVTITQIQLCTKGLRAVERKISDDMVLF